MQTERRAGGLLGLLVGDALGVPYEFAPAEQIPPFDAIELEPPEGFCRAHGGTPPGTWSDDGAQALCLLASLLERGRLDVEDFAKRIVDWYERGYMAVDGRVFDVGVQTRAALEAIRAGTPPLEAARRDERANEGGYEAVVKRAVAFGDDTDTTAAVAGGIAGIRHGPAGIPERWRSALRGRELLAPLLAALG